MKTITIPKRFGYPTLDITVNGKEYTLKSGEEITVEDFIADAIENAIALAPEIGVPRNKIARLAEDSLTEVTAEDLAGISTLRRCAFYWCGSLKTATIPDNITELLSYAFSYCSGLETVYLPEVPPILGTDCFKTIPSSCTFYCKTQASLEAYLSAENWSTLAEKHTFKVKS